MIDVNIGSLIAQKLVELKISKSDFARRLGMANQNINRILEKKSIDTDKLAEISEALGYNFFQAYVEDGSNHHEQAIANGDSSVAVAHNTGSISASTGDTAVLQERVKSLEALVAEKERLIKVYEKVLEKK